MDINQIEVLKECMINLANQYGRSHPSVLSLSQCIDSLVVEELKEKQKNS